MAKKWSEVTSLPEYKSLSPQERDSARRQYFDDVIVPQVPENDRDVALRQFLLDTDKDVGLVQPSTPPEQEGGYLWNLAKSTAQGVESFVRSSLPSAGGGLLKAIVSGSDALPGNENLLPLGMRFSKGLKDVSRRPLTAVGEKLSEVGRNQALELPAPPGRPFSFKDPETVGQMIGQGLPTMALPYATGLTTAIATKSPTAALVATTGVGFGLETGFAYEEAKQRGLSDPQAADVAKRIGVVNSALEMLPVMKLLKKTGLIKEVGKDVVNNLVKKGVFKKAGQVGKDVFEQMVTEGATETIQELDNILQIENAEGKSAKQIIKELQKPETLNRLKEAGIAGGLMGAIAGGAGGVYTQSKKAPVTPTENKTKTVEPAEESNAEATAEAARKSKDEAVTRFKERIAQQKAEQTEGSYKKRVRGEIQTGMKEYHSVKKELNETVSKEELSQQLAQEYEDAGYDPAEAKRIADDEIKNRNVDSPDVERIPEEILTYAKLLRGEYGIPAQESIAESVRYHTEKARNEIKAVKAEKQTVQKPVQKPDLPNYDDLSDYVDLSEYSQNEEQLMRDIVTNLRDRKLPREQADDVIDGIQRRLEDNPELPLDEVIEESMQEVNEKRRIPTQKELFKMTYKEIQSKAKGLGIRANQTSGALVDAMNRMRKESKTPAESTKNATPKVATPEVVSEKKPATPKPAKPKPKPAEAKGKEPWEMTRGEWESEWEKNYPGTAFTSKSKASVGQQVAKADNLSNLAYGQNDEIKERIRLASEGKINLTPDELSDIQWELNITSHKKVVAKALSEGKPVPAEVLADYPDLSKKYGKKESEVADTPKEAVQEIKKSYGSKNKVFTKETKDVADKDFAQKTGQLNAGFDPKIFKDVIQIGGYHFEAAFRAAGDKVMDFAAFSKKMIEELGDDVKPYLKAAYDKIIVTPGADWVKDTAKPKVADAKKEVADEKSYDIKLSDESDKKLQESFAIGEASPSEQDLPKGMKVRGNLGSDLHEATRLMGSTARHSKMQGLMLGSFIPELSKINVKDIRWTRTLAHELGHAIDFKMNNNKFFRNIKQRFSGLKISEDAARAELKKASEFIRPMPAEYFSSKATKEQQDIVQYRKQTKEMMADLFSLYVHDPKKAMDLAPNVTESMMNAINSNPEVAPIVNMVLSNETKLSANNHGDELTTLPPKPELVYSTPDPFLRGQSMEVVKSAKRWIEAMLYHVGRVSRKWREALTEKKRCDVGAFVEGIGNIQIKGDTIEDVKARMTPKMHEVAKAYRNEIEIVRQEANKMMDNAGQGEEYIKYLSDYLSHFYVQNPKKMFQFVTKWSKTTPHAKKRTFPTLKEAMDAGLTPLTQDVAYLYERAAENNYRAAATHELLKQLKDLRTIDGSPVISGKKIGDDWKMIQHPVLKQYYAFKDKNGKTVLGEGHAWVHPAIERPVKVMLDSPWSGSVVNTIQAINSFAKAMNVGFSLFHEVTLGESSQAVNANFLNPLRGIIISPSESKALGLGWRPRFTYKAGLKLMENDPLGVEDAIKSSLMVGSRSASTDASRGFVEDKLFKLEAIARRMPYLQLPVRKIRQIIKGYNVHLWDNVLPGYKYFSYHTAVAKALEGMPAGVSVKSVKESVANIINDAFGGQEFLQMPIYKKGYGVETMPMTVKEAQLAKIMIFAPDWTWSNIRVAGKPVINFKNKVQRNLGIIYWRNMVLTLAGFAISFQGAIYSAFGDDDKDMKKFPWQNEPGRKWDVDVTPFINHVRKIYGAEPLDHRAYVHAGKQAREVIRYFDDFPKGLMQNIGNKSSNIIRMSYEQFEGKQLGSDYPLPWAGNAYAEELEGWEKIKERGKALGKHFMPFALQGGNFLFSLPMRKGMTKYKTMVCYNDAIRTYVDPSFFKKLMDYTDEERMAQVGKAMIEVDNAAEANGIPKEKREELFNSARSRVKGLYYGKFWKAIEDQDFEDAEKYAGILVNLGVTSRNVKASGKRRDTEESAINEGSKILRSSREEDIFDYNKLMEKYR